MDTTTRTNTTQAATTEKPTGLEDVVRSVRVLARSARNLGVASAEVVERELAMAISISAQLRDDVISKAMLEEARREELPAKLRKDAHDTVNLLADAGAVLFLAATRFLENFADQRRPPLNAPSQAVNVTPNVTVTT